MAARRPSLFTIGYEQTTAASVLDELQRNGVRLVVDVRAVAASRRPGFSKRQLAAALDEHNIGYLHLQKLGTPKEGRLAARAGRTQTMLAIYERQLETPPAREELKALCDLVREGRPVCLLCFERDPHHCHRRRIAECVAVETGARTVDLFAPPPLPLR